MTTRVLQEGAPEDVGLDPIRIARLRELLAGWVASGDTASVAALVARRGKIVLHEAFGVLRHNDHKPPLRKDSLFPLTSSSKSLTAAAVMCLVDDGLIGLNRSLLDYVPELDRPDEPGLAAATVADLLSHTSGIDDVIVGNFIAESGKWETMNPTPVRGRHPTINKVIHLMAGAPLGGSPGAAMLYSNFGYMLLGDIVRHVSNQPFSQFVQARLFEPLGMHDAHFVLPPDLRDRRVMRAPGMPGSAPSSPWSRGIDSPELDETDWGQNGATATAGDLARFMQMLLNGGAYGDRRILSPASVAAMTRPQVDTRIPWIMPLINPATKERIDMKVPGGGYGYGLFVFASGDRFIANGSLASLTAFGHAGFGGNFVWADPEQEMVGVFLNVAPRMGRDFALVNSDLFQNAVHAAIID